MKAVYKKELKAYFQSIIGCVFIAFLIAFTGIYFMAYNMTTGYPYFSYTLSGSLIVFIVGIPLITMRSFAEERKNKTDQILLTAPVSLWKVVVGKYLAMVTVIAIPNLIFCIFPLIIKLQGTAYLTVDYISILMFFLLGCVFAAIGMAFISAYRKSNYCVYRDVWYFSDSIFMGWYLISVSKYGDERTCVYNFAYFAGSFLHMENDEQFFDCGRSGLCRSGSSDSSVFSERDAL